MGSVLADVSNRTAFAKRITPAEYERQAQATTAQMVQQLNEEIRNDPSLAKGSVFFANKENIKKGLPVFQGKHSRFIYENDTVASVVVEESVNEPARAWELESGRTDDIKEASASPKVNYEGDEEWWDAAHTEWAEDDAQGWLEEASYENLSEGGEWGAEQDSFPESPDMERSATELGRLESSEDNSCHARHLELSEQLQACSLVASEKQNSHLRFLEEGDE